MNSGHMARIRSLENEYGSIAETPDDNEILIGLQIELALASMYVIDKDSFYGEPIKLRLNQMRMTYEELGVEIGISRSGVWNKLNSKKPITYDHLCGILEVTGLRLRDVVDDRTYTELCVLREEGLIEEVVGSFEREEEGWEEWSEDYRQEQEEQRGEFYDGAVFYTNE